jgi:O-acetyl-ADP-ribose deacetylase (regulator of RNase III)
MIVPYDILNIPFHVDYIAHQCNCTSRGSKGLAKSIFEKYPYANTYGMYREPGTIHVRGNVINMYAQRRPGLPSGDDTPSLRILWFKSCLKEILKIEGIHSIAFPYRIGCGLAGGDWKQYQEMILRAFDDLDIEVYICNPLIKS